MEKNRFFEDQKDGPENILIYCNQGTISTLKSRDYAIYLHYVILGQIIPVSNSLPDLDNYALKENEVILYVPLYNTETVHFRDVKKWLGVIMIRGDPYEVFLSCGYVEARSKVSCSSFKHPLRNMFQGTAF